MEAYLFPVAKIKAAKTFSHFYIALYDLHFSTEEFYLFKKKGHYGLQGDYHINILKIYSKIKYVISLMTYPS